MESHNISKISSNRPKSKRTALSEVSNTQKSKKAKHRLQSETRDSDSSKEVVNSPSKVMEENEKDSDTQKTVIFNSTEINIPAPRKVVSPSPTKLTWYYSPRVVIPVVTPPEVTINKPNFNAMKSNDNPISTIKKNSKKSKPNVKKSQPNNNVSLLNWFGPTSSNSGSDIFNPTSNENDSKNSQSETRPIVNLDKKEQKKNEESDLMFFASLSAFENVDLGIIDMNLVTDILRLYDFIVKFEKVLEIELDYNGDKLKYAHLEEMILDSRLHTRLAFLQSRLLSFLYKESGDEHDIDLVNLQYYLTERFPNRKFLFEKEYSEFSPRERMFIFNDLMNEALHTNKLHDFIKELMNLSTHKKENGIRAAKMKEIKFEINEIRVKRINKENELKNIEEQLKEKTTSFENEDVVMDLPKAVTKRQRIVAKRKAEQEVLSELNEQRKNAINEMELLLHKLNKLDLEHKKLEMLNKTERDHANCILRGGSILNSSGRDERFYMIVRLGQDRDGRNYWYYRMLGGVFVETIKWNYPEQDSNDSTQLLTSPSEWQLINGIGIFRKFLTVLNTHNNKEKILKSNLKVLEKEIELTFDKLNSWIEKKRDVKSEQIKDDSEEVKNIMTQHQKSFWKLFDTVVRKKNVWSSKEYDIIMREYVKRKVTELEKIMRQVNPNLTFEESQSVNASDLVKVVKNMITETGLKFTNTSTTSPKKDKTWDWLYNVAVDWYSLDIKTLSTLAVWLDVMIGAGEPVVRSIKKRMQEQLMEKLKCSTRLRDKKSKIVEYKEENTDDEIEENDIKEQKMSSKWSLRERKRIAYKK